MSTTKKHDELIANLTFASVYPHYITKAEKKNSEKIAELTNQLLQANEEKSSLTEMIETLNETLNTCKVEREKSKIDFILRQNSWTEQFNNFKMESNLDHEFKQK